MDFPTKYFKVCVLINKILKRKIFYSLNYRNKFIGVLHSPILIKTRRTLSSNFMLFKLGHFVNCI